MNELSKGSPNQTSSKVKLLVGRPKKSNAYGGRERLIAGTVALLRSQPNLAMNRKEVAKAAKVTPSLVTYYYPDHLRLLEDATTAIIHGYVKKLSIILEQDNGKIYTLRKIIRLFLEINATDSALMDSHLLVLSSKFNNEALVSIVVGAYKDLVEYLEKIRGEETWHISNPDTFLLALWGMCKAVAQPPRLPVSIFGIEPTTKLNAHTQADFMLELICNGIKRWGT